MKGWDLSRQEFNPTPELTSLNDDEQVSEMDTKAVTDQAGFGSRIVDELRHWMIRMKFKTRWWSSGR